MRWKRNLSELGEFKRVSDLPSEAGRAKVHGVVKALSPMKQGRKWNYFEGELSDGQKEVRLYGYDKSVRAQLESFLTSGESVAKSLVRGTIGIEFRMHALH